MVEDVWLELRARSAQIDARWALLLQGEPVSTSLALPDLVGRLIPWARAEILAQPGEASVGLLPRAGCPCGRNPLLAFFLAGEQALLETLVLIQVESGLLDPPARDRACAQLRHAIRRVARREVGLLCTLCPHARSGAAR